MNMPNAIYRNAMPNDTPILSSQKMRVYGVGGQVALPASRSGTALGGKTASKAAIRRINIGSLHFVPIKDNPNGCPVLAKTPNGTVTIGYPE